MTKMHADNNLPIARMQVAYQNNWPRGIPTLLNRFRCCCGRGRGDVEGTFKLLPLIRGVTLRGRQWKRNNDSCRRRRRRSTLDPKMMKFKEKNLKNSSFSNQPT